MLYDIEMAIFKKKLDKNNSRSHIFVCGLPRGAVLIFVKRKYGLQCVSIIHDIWVDLLRTAYYVNPFGLTYYAPLIGSTQIGHEYTYAYKYIFVRGSEN